ncbi:S1C family serine protease [Terrirubrum flagellatum]|uniref:S1C family serine protease n=1 Tax=Terrirubrum flagellatum TaxID=2895980 RepID=UPI003CC82910
MSSESTNHFMPAPRPRRRWMVGAAAGALGVAAALAFVPAFSQTGVPAPQAQTQTQGGLIAPRPPALAPVSFADIVERVRPAVVSVKVKIAQASAQDDEDDQQSQQMPDSLQKFFRQFGAPGMNDPRFGGGRQRRGGAIQMGQGSGFFISADGEIVTNNHVVQNATEVEVVTDDGRTLQAKVVGTDPRTDVALLKVKDKGNFPYVQLSQSAPRVGDWVLAVGNPFGLGGTVTSGIVSARGRDIGSGPYDDFLQIDAPVNRGNSGGPTFGLDGKVVGVNTAIYSPSGGSVGIAFAIPSQTVEKVVAALREGKSVARGFIGVSLQPVSSELADALGLSDAHGAMVAAVTDNSPAEKAGLKKGDLVTAIDGEKVSDPRELARKIGTMNPGQTAKLTVLHRGQERTVSIELARQPAEKAANDSRSKGQG